MKADTLLRRLARALILPLLLPLTLAPPARAQAEPANTLALGPDGSANVLVVHASNNLPVFRGVLEDFHRIHPALRLEYTELPTQALYDEIIARRRDATSEKSGPDLVISSAMDLQTKLANDGYALPHDSPETRALPAWANWRDEVFSTGTDPIVMVYDTRRLDAARAPRTRRALLSLLQAPDRPLAGAVSTYDVGASAIGYLAATRTRAWTAWRRRCWRRWARTTRRCMPRRTTRWTCWNAATPRWPTTCWSPIPATASNAAPRWPSSTRATTR